VPEQVLYDRMRTMFSRENAEAGQIVFNHTLLEFAPPTSKTASASSYHPIALIRRTRPFWRRCGCST
jgi:hypothetical protein